ncbi:mechanosensitive ion channel family protein [Sphingobacterium chungjuense]|uniref:mechanosensitive ion channel family protein n=1 Tax=Sphingobacterium chungjuense TaxID=2675553 RepID=UPI00140E6AB7|nr:mechanosensitive ion channel domain-containing protein [Sphingobacterium chungjuense]
MTTITKIFIALLFFFCVAIAYGFQQPSQDTLQSRADTVTAINQRSVDLMQLMEQQRRDSVKRLALENQLLSLQLNDRQENQRLVAELRVLQSRDSILLARRKQKVDSLKLLNDGVPVIPFRDTIFRIYTSLGSYTAKDRAMAIEERIRNLAANLDFQVDSLRAWENENNWIIAWNDQMIISFNDQDALWTNIDIASLAAMKLQEIKATITKHREETSLKNLLISLSRAALIITVLSLLVIGMSRLATWTRRKLIVNRGKRLQGVQVRGYQLISPARQVRILWIIITAVKWILILTVIYLALPMMLNLFPSTRGYTPVLLGYFLNPLRDMGASIVAYFPNLITIIVICVVFRYALKVLKFFAGELRTGALHIPGFFPDWALPTYHILRVLLLAFLMIVIFPYLPGSDSSIFKGVSVFIGVLFTFSSAGALGNIVAGLVLTYMRSFSLGDRVKIGDLSGDIIEKSLLVTRIRTTKNEVISVPNSQVMNSHTINYSADSQEKGLIIHTNLTMSYETRWQTVHQLAIKAALRVEFIEAEPAPFVLQNSLDDFYITYQINAYTKHPNKQAQIYSELHKSLMDVFHEADIELLSPHYNAIRDGNKRDLPDAFGTKSDDKLH